MFLYEVLSKFNYFPSFHKPKWVPDSDGWKYACIIPLIKIKRGNRTKCEYQRSASLASIFYKLPEHIYCFILTIIKEMEFFT